MKMFRFNCFRIKIFNNHVFLYKLPRPESLHRFENGFYPNAIPARPDHPELRGVSNQQNARPDEVHRQLSTTPLPIDDPRIQKASLGTN